MAASAIAANTATANTSTHSGFYVYGICDNILRNSVKLFRLIRKTFPDIEVRKAVPTRNHLYICTKRSKDSYRLKDLTAWKATPEFATITVVTPVVHREKQKRDKQKVKVAEFPVVAKGISPEISETEILETLKENSQFVKKVIRLKSGAQGKPTFRVKVIFTNKGTAEDALLNGLSLGYKRHSVEQYRVMATPFCGNCLQWGHGTRECQFNKRCYTCGDTGHLLKDCTAKDATCANCGASHKPAYKGCPAYQTEVRKLLQKPPRGVATSFKYKPRSPTESATTQQAIVVPQTTTDVSTSTSFEDLTTTQLTSVEPMETQLDFKDSSTQTDPVTQAQSPIRQEHWKHMFLSFTSNVLAHSWEDTEKQVLLSDFLFGAEKHWELNITVQDLLSHAAKHYDNLRVSKEIWRYKNQKREEKESIAKAQREAQPVRELLTELSTEDCTSTSETESITTIFSDISEADIPTPLPKPVTQLRKAKQPKRRIKNK